MRALVIGSRGSQLALWQARWIAARLKELGRDTRIEIIKTTGDKIVDVPLAKVGSSTGLKGVFTKEIEEALLDGRIDLAVHSLKDLPTELPDGLTIGAVPERADPRDVLAGKTLDELVAGDIVGTSSLRRAAQLRYIRPDLEIADIRGNVDTRLRKLDEGNYASIVLAAAGLKRLDMAGRIAETLDASVMAPAVGQGALAVEIREDDDETRESLAPLDHQEARTAVEAERALLGALGGGCQVPLGAHSLQRENELELAAVVASADGKRLIRARASGDSSKPTLLGIAVAEQLKQQGAADLIG